jgi:hypothetical protein
MSITLNFHNTKKVAFAYSKSDDTEWSTLYLTDELGGVQDIGLFDVTLYDLADALEKELLKRASIRGIHEDESTHSSR